MNEDLYVVVQIRNLVYNQYEEDKFFGPTSKTECQRYIDDLRYESDRTDGYFAMYTRYVIKKVNWTVD